MEQHGAKPSQDPKKDRNQAQTANLTQTQDFAVQDATSTNGALPNGIPLLHQSAPATNGAAAGASRTPPELDQSWRESHANKPLGLMLGRLAQQCHTDLNEVINKMSELPAPQKTTQMNGLSQAGVDISENSLTRKRMFMEFAQNQRDRFIKSLVLTDWARNAGDDMAKLIDIRVWEDQQRNASANAISRIGAIKHSLQSAKMPAPNIEGAMELLATGKAPSRIPDMGYLPLKPLSAKQLLKTLRDMNVILSERLIVHEDPPPHFNDYDIANGRATFRVANEFEVDLSVADEDLTTPFYFIDFRFAFSPAPKVLNEQFRAHLEERCNQALAKDGLSGCYDFLHNFVLTQKITFLRDQANELNRQGRWFRSLHIDHLRRVLCVQYWANRSGPKNWLQFSVVSGKQNNVDSKRPFTPRLRVLWFRHGVQVDDDPVEVDWQTVDLEKILEITVAKHVCYLLKTMQDRLGALTTSGESMLKASLAASVNVPEDCSLTLQLRTVNVFLKVSFEAVTGRITFSPPTPLTTRIEDRLNRDPALDRGMVLANMLCGEVLERVKMFAELRGWQATTGLVRQDNIATLFGRDVLDRRMYTCRRGWGSDWALVVTLSLSGQKWWVVRLRQVEHGRIIGSARPIPGSPGISRESLRVVERLAEAEVFFTVLSKQLTDMNIPHKFDRLTLLPTDSKNKTFDETLSTVAMFVKASALGRISRGRENPPWANDTLRITHQSAEVDVLLEGELLRMSYEARVNVAPNTFESLRDHLAGSLQSDILMNDSGSVVLRRQTQFGRPSAEQIMTQLGNVQRLDEYISLLKKLKWRCIDANLLKIAFVYCETPLLSAEVSFPRGDGKKVRLLRLFPEGSNPHQQIRTTVESKMAEQRGKEFETLTTTLRMTLPLLLAFERIEAKDVNRQVILLHVRSPLWFNMTYRTPLPPCAFDIRVRRRFLDGKLNLYWYITRSERPGNVELPQSITDALHELYTHPNENGWRGIGSGIVAEPPSIAAAIEQLDTTMRKFEGVDIKPPADELDSKPLIQQTSLKTVPPPPPPTQRQPPTQQVPQAQMLTQHQQIQRQRQIALQQQQQQYVNQQRLQQQQQQQQQQQPQMQVQRPMPNNQHPQYPQQNRPNGNAMQNVRNDVIEID